MNWLDPRRYSFPVLISVVLHIVVATVFIVQWPTEHRMPEPVPQHIIATVVQEQNAAQKELKLKQEKQRKRDELAAKRAEEKKVREEKERVAAEKKKVAEKKKLEQEKALKEKKLAEQKAKEKATKEKADKDKAAKEKAAKEKEAKDKAAEAKAAKERAAQEDALMEQLAREQAEADVKAQQKAAKQAEEAATMKADAAADIRAKVQSVWSYPPAVNPSMETVVRITMVPTGQVMQVDIIKSSGNAALDRSVEQAIYKASPLPVPKDPRVFERDFRKFVINFRPENATW